MLHKSACSPLGFIIAGLGSVAVCVGVERDRDVLILGALAILLGFMLSLARELAVRIERAARPASDVFAEGLELGYEKRDRELAEERRGEIRVVGGISAAGG